MKVTQFVKLFAVAALAIGSLGATASAAIIVSDDFESYADTAAMNAVWVPTTSGTGGQPQSLNTTFGNGGKSFSQPKTPTNNVGVRSIAAVKPLAGQTLRYTVDIHDQGTNGKRISAGLRNTSTANILEMGMYNTAPAPHYAIRLTNFGSATLPPTAAGGWAVFTNLVNDLGAPISNAPVVGWHRFSVELTPTNAKFTLDLNSDGFINATLNVPITIQAAGFNAVRLGSPGVTSTEVAHFDNVRLELVPEPATLALAGMGAMGLVAVARRRNG